MTGRTAYWEEMPYPCACRGPQNGEPLCPCMMRQKRTMEVDKLFPEPEPVSSYPLDINWDKDNTKQKCLFVEFIKHNPDKAGEPLWLSCPCPKCTPRC